MRRLGLFLLLAGISGLAFAQGYEGVFQGEIVKAKSAKQGWLYVLSKNGYLRQVDVHKAQVEYDEDYPARKRRKRPEDSLRPAAVIRVTAHQGQDGEWHASHVLIISPRQRSHGSGTEGLKSSVLNVSGADVSASK